MNITTFNKWRELSNGSLSLHFDTFPKKVAEKYLIILSAELAVIKSVARFACYVTGFEMFLLHVMYNTKVRMKLNQK